MFPRIAINAAVIARYDAVSVVVQRAKSTGGIRHYDPARHSGVSEVPLCRPYNHVRMSLSAGSRFGSYEILSVIGEGGMGRVYRARDATLQRIVAVKVLPESVAGDAERIARFEREARTLAALNHPHIAQIFAVEDGAIVMEMVEGEDLAQRIARGPLPWREALPIAKQIAEALEAAHEQGIIHRDLKPANIKVTADGVVKVLDFGLAKAAANPKTDASDPHRLAQSPTVTSPAGMTQAGMILGTAAYMSPEQAKGRAADKRSDVWSFGCVLFEMLTGKRAFPGDDVMETLSAVIRTDPDVSAIPRDVPSSVRALIEQCLIKDRRERISDIAAARYALRLPDALSRAEPETATARLTWAVVAIAGVVAVAAVALAWPRLTSRTPEPPLVIRSLIAAPSAATAGFATHGHLSTRHAHRLRVDPRPDAHSAAQRVGCPAAAGHRRRCQPVLLVRRPMACLLR